MRVSSFLAPAVLSFAFHHLVSASNDAGFHPDSYPKHIATCKAVNRAVNHSTQVDIKLRTSVYLSSRRLWVQFQAHIPPLQIMLILILKRRRR
jgi:hypothetical protein